MSIARNPFTGRLRPLIFNGIVGTLMLATLPLGQAQNSDGTDFAGSQILIAQCDGDQGGVIEQCRDPNLQSFWARESFYAWIGVQKSDFSGAVPPLRVYANVAELNGLTFILTQGTDPADPVSIYLNAIEVTALGQLYGASVDVIVLSSIQPMQTAPFANQTASPAPGDAAGLASGDEKASDQVEVPDDIDAAGAPSAQSQIAGGDQTDVHIGTTQGESVTALNPSTSSSSAQGDDLDLPVQAASPSSSSSATTSSSTATSSSSTSSSSATSSAMASLPAPPTLTVATIDQLAHCRALASRALDGGFDLVDLDAEAALAACRPVASVLVDEPEVQYLYARALDASGLRKAAIDGYQLASRLGSGKADASLGRAYVESALEGRQSLALAALESGAERGDPIAAFRLYHHLSGGNNQVQDKDQDQDKDKDKDKDHRNRLLMQAIDAGYSPAILEAARKFVDDPASLALSADDIDALLVNAAAQGDVSSKSYLGRQWLSANDTARQEQAIVYLRDAAGQGDKSAASTLGLLLLSGKIVPVDGDDPRQLLEIAGNQASGTVKSALAALILTQDGADADPERVVALLSAAAAAGRAGSATNLGTLYRTGLLVPQDMDLAARWYLIGLALGSDDFSEQIFGYVAWDQRGGDGLITATKAYLDLSGWLEGAVDDQADSVLAKGVARYLANADPMAEAALLMAVQ